MKQRNGKGALLWPEKAPLTEVKVVQKSERVHFNVPRYGLGTTFSVPRNTNRFFKFGLLNRT